MLRVWLVCGLTSPVFLFWAPKQFIGLEEQVGLRIGQISCHERVVRTANCPRAAVFQASERARTSKLKPDTQTRGRSARDSVARRGAPGHVDAGRIRRRELECARVRSWGCGVRAPCGVAEDWGVEPVAGSRY